MGKLTKNTPIKSIVKTLKIPSLLHRDDTEILSQLLNRGYDWRVRPPGTNLSMPGTEQC